VDFRAQVSSSMATPRPNPAQELSHTTQASLGATNNDANQDALNPALVSPVSSSIDTHGQSKAPISDERGISIDHYQALAQSDEAIGERDHHLLSSSNAPHGSKQESKNAGDSESLLVPPTPEEELLKAIRDKLPSSEILSRLSRDQVEILNVIAQSVKHLEDTKIEFVWNSALQLAGLLFVVIFGVFAALAYDAAAVANKQSSEANQLSLLTFCLLNPVSIHVSLLAIILNLQRM
jgi:hypothetical protein